MGKIPQRALAEAYDKRDTRGTLFILRDRIALCQKYAAPSLSRALSDIYNAFATARLSVANERKVLSMQPDQLVSCAERMVQNRPFSQDTVNNILTTA